jgi:hypothetical protein
MRKVTNIILLCSCVFVLFTSCVSLKKTADKEDELAGEKLTVETVQKEIRKGMVRVEVEGVLGVTKNLLSDEQGWVVMIYDRISAVNVERVSSDRDSLALFGLASKDDDDDPSNQRKNFTIVIRLDHDDQVYDFDFYPSKF